MFCFDGIDRDATFSAPKWIRGAIVSLYQWAVTIGLLLASVINYGTRNRVGNSSWQIPIAIQFIWAFILTCGMILLPEVRNLLFPSLTSKLSWNSLLVGLSSVVVMPMLRSHLLASLVIKTIPQQSNLSCRKFGPTSKLRKLWVHPPILTALDSPTIRCVSVQSLEFSSKHGNNSQAVSTKVRLELGSTISGLFSSQLYFLLWNNVLPKLRHQ